MLCKLGTYELPEGRVEITRRDTPEFNEAGQVLSNTIRLECSSALYSSSVSAMDALVASLIAAFSETGNDFQVLLPGGVTDSQLSLFGSGSFSGVRVVQPPAFESLRNGAYVTWLPFSFALEAEYPASNSTLLLREYTEEVNYQSPEREDWLLCLHGPHQRQIVRQYPFYTATQTGRAIGYRAYPTPASPIWPAYWMNRDELPVKRAPRRRGSLFTDYEISWRWTFKSDRPLIGSPNTWQ